MKKKYFYLKIEKPFSPTSRIVGRTYHSCKEWVEDRFRRKNKIYENPVTGAELFESEDYFEIFAEHEKDIKEMIKLKMQ